MQGRKTKDHMAQTNCRRAPDPESHPGHYSETFSKRHQWLSFVAALCVLQHNGQGVSIMIGMYMNFLLG